MLRIKINFRLGKERLLPVNYQPYFLDWIRHNLKNATNGDLYSLFEVPNSVIHLRNICFSNLEIGRYTLTEDHKFFQIDSPVVSLVVAARIDDAYHQDFIMAFQDKVVSIAEHEKNTIRLAAEVVNREVEPEFTEFMNFRTISPLCVAVKEEDKTQFLSPEDPRFQRAFFSNVIHKYKTYSGNTEFSTSKNEFRLLTSPKAKLISFITPNGTMQVRGYICDFKLRTSIELVKMGYYVGFGENNSLGFGCVKIQK